jgi:hypothetical protein
MALYGQIHWPPRPRTTTTGQLSAKDSWTSEMLPGNHSKRNSKLPITGK